MTWRFWGIILFLSSSWAAETAARPAFPGESIRHPVANRPNGFKTHRVVERVVQDTLKAMKAKSPIVYGHLRRTGMYSALIAQELKLQPRLTQLMLEAGYVHDIGKLLVPTPILESMKRLTPDQRLIIREHTDYGAKLLEPRNSTARLPWELKLLLPAIRNHHEHYDGTGSYGLKGTQIPVAARIVAVADAFDAMTSVRGYNKPLNTQEALRELQREAGKQFDPKIVSAFTRALTKHLPERSNPLKQVDSTP